MIRMPTCKILFFLLLALFVLCGECDEFIKYGQVGGEVIMACEVPQNSDVEWKLNDILIVKINGRRGTRQKGHSHIRDKVSVNGGSLKVPRLETKDSGVYSCNSRKRYTLHVVSVFAKPGPVLLQSSSVELHCDIDGNPNTEVQWQSPSNDKKDDKKQVIHLKSVSSKDDGQWTCLIKDDLKLSLKLTVVAGLQTTAVKVPEGENITLPCSLPLRVSQHVVGGKWTADHLPTVPFPTLKNTETKGLHWSGDDSSKVTFTSDQLNINYDVMLTNAQRSDEGKYVCTVEFEGGVKLTAETNLMVVAKPSGEGLSVVQDILGVDSPVLAGISGGLESEAEPEEHNTEPSQQSKQLQHQQSGSSTPNQAGTKKKQIPSPAAVREELLELQRDVLQLQKIKLQLEIEKLKKEKENQDL